MPSIDVEKTVDAPVAPATNTAIQPVIGIIYPPPEVRNIVDKTASFVARNGPEFESRIRQNELGNAKFNFLNIGDPYHAYYQHKVKEIKEGKIPDGSAVQTTQIAPAKALTTATQQKQQEILKQMEQQPFIPKDPPAEFEFFADPPSISALDLDIVKLTAQFVARNGRQFLTNLMNREQRNFQFDFLRPQHSLFHYFTRLLEQYTKVLIPPKDLLNKLKEESNNPTVVLEQVKYRSDWIRHQEAQKRKEEMAIEKERVAYAQIDWHDFVVVETVDYIPGELGNFPPPTTPEEVGARVLMQERVLDGGPPHHEPDLPVEIEEEEEEEIYRPERVQDHDVDNTQVQDMEEESESEGEDDKRDDDRHQAMSRQNILPPPPPGVGPFPTDKKLPPLPPAMDKVIVKKGYNPKQGVKAPKPTDQYLISPLTGGKIPASKVQEHMRIGLLDPRWVEQRDKNIQDKINQENVYAPGSAIEASLKQLAERRTDIFGVGDEETAIGKKIGEEDKKKEDKVTWDGHTSSVEAATRAARANITIEDQIHQIHKVKGLLPDEEKEKIGPKPVTGKASVTIPGTISQPPLPATTVQAPPLPKPQPPPPLPPMSAPLPPPPGMMATGQPSIMMVPAPIRPPILVPPGTFGVVTATPPAFMPGPPNTGPTPQMGALLQKAHGDPKLPDDEPPTKKQKSEESLIPETEFIIQNPGPVLFSIMCPIVNDKPEWKLAGQILSFQMSLEENISAVKLKIKEMTGMPPAKQKLQNEGMFFKDSNSLAYYNITSGAAIQLLVKERGGRKK